MSPERFIPFRKQDVIDMCVNEMDSPSQVPLRQLCELLSSLIHYQYHGLLESLKSSYAPFDPNADTRSLHVLSQTERRAHQKQFADDFARVLDAANFEQITEQDLHDAMTEESLFKVRLEVEFDDFEQVVFYRRGESTRSEIVRSWWGLRKETIQFTNYDRVAVFITFKGEAHFAKKKKQPLGFEPSSTIVKLFQNVPKADLEMLFPNSEVRMRPLDKAIIGASAVVGGAVVLVTKLGASIILLAALIGFWLGFHNDTVEMTEQHMISFALGMGVFGSFIFKEWSKFKNRKIKFMKALSDNLYYKNLDNNAGVFHTLVDAAEEEDIKEALLAYCFLLKNQNAMTPTELDSQIERWFKQHHDCVLDFEIMDALNKLEKLALVVIRDDCYQAIGIEQAKTRLDKQWDDIFNYNLA